MRLAPFLEGSTIKIAVGSEKEDVNELFHRTLAYDSSPLSLYLDGVDYDRNGSGLFSWAGSIRWESTSPYIWNIISRKRKSATRVGVIEFITSDECNYLSLEYVKYIDREIASLIDLIKYNLETAGFTIVGDRDLAKLPSPPTIDSSAQEENPFLQKESQPASTMPESSPQSFSGQESYSEPLSKEDARKILEDIPKMKKIFQDYNLKTALAILDGLHDSWIASKYDMAGRWGPGIISGRLEVGSTTIGRYLGAFRTAGINEINVDEEIIPLPHHSKK